MPTHQRRSVPTPRSHSLVVHRTYTPSRTQLNSQPLRNCLLGRDTAWTRLLHGRAVRWILVALTPNQAITLAFELDAAAGEVALQLPAR
jgi:hypothetical protein